MSQPQQLVQLIQLVQKAKQRIPEHLRGPTYYSSNDVWVYEESEHPNMCDDCHSYNLQNFTGTQIRAEFPYSEIIDENFIYPKVHPHCFCALTRLFPVSIDAENEVYVKPESVTELKPEVIDNLTNLSQDDFIRAVESMLTAGYITISLLDNLKLQRQKKRGPLTEPIEE